MVEPAVELAVPLLEGKRFGRYLLRHRLARGGMASIYLAQLAGAHGFEKWVALKVIHPHLAEDRRFVQMFLDEARLASRIHHPNVCQVLDFGEEEGTAYLVMEYLHGETLAAVIRRSKQIGAPLWLPTRMIVDAARGLHAAHELRGLDGHPLGIVHRDVSPQNVLVLYDGLSKVMDFGVARARGRIAETTAGELKGKISYMAPEQLESRSIDRRTDVWSLGVVLWEATVRKRLFRGESEGATALNVVRMEIPRPSSLVDGFPPALEDAVMGALQRDPDRRFATAAELADACETYLYSTGRPAGHSQVAEWMGRALSERRTQRDRLLRQSTAPPAQVEADMESASSLGSMPSEVQRTRVGLRRPQGSGRVLGVLVAVLAFAVGVLLAWVLFGDRSATETVASEERHGEPEAEPGSAEPATEPAAEARPASAAPAPEEEAATDDGPRAEEAPVTPERAAADRASGDDAPAAGDGQPARSREPARVRVEPAQHTRPRAERTGRRSRGGRSAASAPAREPGTLNLLAIPAAEVFLGGRPLGRTPLVNRELPAGRHVLVLRPVDGGEERRVTVRIEPGENTRTSVRLDQ